MRPHPLTVALIEQLARNPKARVLELGSGRGRNSDAMHRAGVQVVSLDDERAGSASEIVAEGTRFDGVLATHALLHGTPQSVAERVAAVDRVLAPGGLFYATFASTHDARYGGGKRVADDTYAPAEGDEAGVSHVYYDESRLRAILTPYFHVESLEERAVDDVAGTWAHPHNPLRGAVHWFFVGRRHE